MRNLYNLNKQVLKSVSILTVFMIAFVHVSNAQAVKFDEKGQVVQIANDKGQMISVPVPQPKNNKQIEIKREKAELAPENPATGINNTPKPFTFPNESSEVKEVALNSETPKAVYFDNGYVKFELSGDVKKDAESMEKAIADLKANNPELYTKMINEPMGIQKPVINKNNNPESK